MINCKTLWIRKWENNCNSEVVGEEIEESESNLDSADLDYLTIN
jgi:hypothetical protein